MENRLYREMRVLLVDNYDSFTHNIAQLFATISDHAPLVLPNDTSLPARRTRREAVLALLAPFHAVILSPGPGHPDNERDFGLCRDILEYSDLPVLGICLGMQGICSHSGGEIVQADRQMHGRISMIYHSGKGLFRNIPDGFEAVRYHSLVAGSVGADLRITARTARTEIMAVEHVNRPLFGVQFHPESISSEFGSRLARNFLDLAGDYHLDHPELRFRYPGNVLLPTEPSGRSPVRTARPCLPGAQESPLKLYCHPLSVWRSCEIVFREFSGDDPWVQWLDSSSLVPGYSGFSVLGLPGGPMRHILRSRAGSGETCLVTPGTTGAEPFSARFQASIFEAIRDNLEQFRKYGFEDSGFPAPSFGFKGGYIGALSYEMAAECALQGAIGSADPGPDAVPDSLFCFVDRFLLCDHHERKQWLICLDRPDRAADVQDWFAKTEARLMPLWQEPWFEGLPPAPEITSIKANISSEQYARDIIRAQDFIRAGESYEICLTNGFSASFTPGSISDFSLYQRLRQINPAPCSALLRFDNISILSSSPERFLSIDRSGNIEARPIKGTISLGHNEEERKINRKYLEANEKDRAENLMITDLLRNDLGKICRTGSVTVPVLFGIETYATLHQMVSTIRGILKPEISAAEAVQACFPCGSISGAPKRRTMEIIDSLEKRNRGFYTGSLGYFSIDGAADLNVAIRTLEMRGAEIHFGSGGAITALSDPQEEIAELRLKNRALLTALGLDESRTGF